MLGTEATAAVVGVQAGRRSRPESLASATPVAAVLVFSVVVWLLSGVTVWWVLAFLAYQAAFVLGPGLLAYYVLFPEPGGWLRRLVVGWALGFVLEVGAWIAVSGIGTRGLFWAYPPIIAGLSAVPLWRRRDPRTSAAKPSYGLAWRWAVAAVAVAATGAVGALGFHDHPLPDRNHGITWTADSPYDLAIAAQATHEWPISDPNVSGTALPYHTFMHIDSAATSTVTGIPLDVVLYRMKPVLQIILLVLALSFAGATLTRRPWVGPLCAALFLFVGEVNLDPAVPFAWGNELPYDVFDVSPSLLFGLLLFVPTLVLLHEIVDEGGRDRGRWIAVAILTLGSIGAKSAGGPILVGGLLIYAIWLRLRWRHLARPAVVALGLTLLVSGLFYVTVYAAAGQADLRLSIPGTVRDMVYVKTLVSNTAAHHGAIWTLLLVLVAPFVMFAAYGAPLVGVWWSARAGRSPATSLLCSIGLAGVGLYLLFESLFASQIYFFEFSLVALVILSADGLTRLAGELTRSWMVRVGLPFAAFWLILLVAVVLLSHSLIGDATDRATVAKHVGVLVAIVGGIIVVAWLGRRRQQRSLRHIAVLALLMLGAITFPLHVIAQRFVSPFDAQPTGTPDLTAGAYAGLDWIRTHTPADAVIAVNNRDVRALGPELNFYYAAFSERQVFVEGRAYTVSALQNPGRPLPFGSRVRLTNEVFGQADPTALATMVHRWHVSYLLVDRTYGATAPALNRIATPVYSNPQVTVYKAERPELDRAARLRGPRATRATQS